MSKCDVLIRKFGENHFQNILGKLYCRDPGETGRFAERFATLLSAFSRNFDTRGEVALFSAPGRTEIGGNHTDHQHGCVVAGSVTVDIAAVAAPNNTNTVRILSGSQPALAVNLDSLCPDPGEKFTSEALVRGIAERFTATGRRVGGFDLATHSTVLKGSGLSSSAAFEVLIGVIFNSLFCDGAVSAVEVAQFGQYAENVHFGKPCGLMDQLASSVGGFLFIDFADPARPNVEKIDFDLSSHKHALCIVDSGADHADLSDVYATIPREMRAVAGYFEREHLRMVDSEDFLHALPEVRKAVGDRAVLRAMHFFNENRRAMDEASMLKAGRFDAFLKIVKASGISSAAYLQNIHVPGASREQGVGVALAVCGEILGERGAYRVHGGGFAGTVQAFVPFDMLDAFRLGVDAALGKGRCHTLSIRPDGGIRLKV